MSGECIESGENGWQISGECIESDLFSKMVILASTRIRQNWRIFWRVLEFDKFAGEWPLLKANTSHMKRAHENTLKPLIRNVFSGKNSIFEENLDFFGRK
jgi:hypothetical protein